MPAAHNRSPTGRCITPRSTRAKIPSRWTRSHCESSRSGESAPVSRRSVTRLITSKSPLSSSWETRRRIELKSEMSVHNGPRIPSWTSSDALLRSVSRSFYLSARILPTRLREPVALGYLLARTTDRVADTVQISRALRIETLQQLTSAIQDATAPEAIVDLAHSFVPLQQNRSERAIVEAL